MATTKKHAERSKRAHKATEAMKAGFFASKQVKKAKAGR